MAKRAAEAVACHAPWEAFVSHRPSKRGRSDSGLGELRCGRTPWSGGGCKKRKRLEGDEETSRKRPTALQRSRSPEEQVPLPSSSRWEGTRTRRQEQPALLAGAGEAPAAQPWDPKASLPEEVSEAEAWRAAGPWRQGSRLRGRGSVRPPLGAGPRGRLVEDF